ncbi:MAG: phosphatase [Clostridia bacterium]|nr:phosphatase [Clostridia bacterium]
MIKIKVDTHTHTNVSAHAFSTLEENLAAAAKIGLEGIAMTNHGPDLGDGAVWFHFKSARHLPRWINGVRLFPGAEVDIMDTDGRLDIEDKYLKDLEIVIASFHTPCFKENSPACDVTKAWLNVMENENVDILGHMGDGRYMCDYEAVVKKAKEKGKIIEINNHSFKVRAGSRENCRTIAQLCKKYSVPVVLSTDAHFSAEVGVVPNSIALLEDINFPEELILNTSLKKLCDYLNIEV